MFLDTSWLWLGVTVLFALLRSYSPVHLEAYSDIRSVTGTDLKATAPAIETTMAPVAVTNAIEAPIPVTEPTTAPVTVKEAVSAIAQVSPSAKATGVPGCDFSLIRDTAEMLGSPPFGYSIGVNLGEWQAAVFQLDELRGALHRHKEALIKRTGSKQYNRVLTDLTSLVETPLRKGCQILQHLQVRLLKLKLKTLDKPNERRYQFNLILYESKISVQELASAAPSALQSEPEKTPLWYSGSYSNASELRSNNCPSNNCFKLGDHHLDYLQVEIPHQLKYALRNLDNKIESEPINSIEAVKEYLWELFYQFYSVLSIVFVTFDSWYGIAVLYVVLSVLLYLIRNGYLQQQLETLDPNIQQKRYYAPENQQQD
ncbi:hypothetical protein F5Y19DRAFT_370511 [Xylariaceae sp. FL1651]|nr:hypothetical protein F5Y19DRAFT_370511 [Xylariaceae sp. FL1651]